jgi:uncharacterized protein (DUF433 family)
MAHNEPELLCKLLQCLDDERNDIYLHLDERFDALTEDQIRDVLTEAHVSFVERKPIYWSGYSQVDCELRMLKAALPGKYGYYHFISGVDLPIKSQDYIHKYFEDRYGEQFLSATRVTTWKIASRYKYYHFEKINNKLPRFWSRSLRYVWSMLQALVFINRMRNVPIKEFYWGQAWFSITHDFASYLVEKEPFIYENFNHGFFNDEVFLATLLMNSPFRGNHSPSSYARLIDWDRGRPYTWTIDEYDEIMSSNAIFSRKFSMKKDSEVIDKIISQIQ